MVSVWWCFTIQKYGVYQWILVLMVFFYGYIMGCLMEWWMSKYHKIPTLWHGWVENPCTKWRVRWEDHWTTVNGRCSLARRVNITKTYQELSCQSSVFTYTVCVWKWGIPQTANVDMIYVNGKLMISTSIISHQPLCFPDKHPAINTFDSPSQYHYMGH